MASGVTCFMPSACCWRVWTLDIGFASFVSFGKFVFSCFQLSFLISLHAFEWQRRALVVLVVS